MIRGTLCVHFMHRHMRDMLVILEKRSHPLSRCPKCDIFITRRLLNIKHQAT